MVLFAVIGFALERALGWRDALIFGLLAGFVIASLVPPGRQKCALPRDPAGGQERT